MDNTGPPRQRSLCLGKPLHLREGGLRLSEPESSCDKVVRDCLKPVYGLFGACHIACFGGCYGWFCEHVICHNWFDDRECYYLPL